MVHRLTGRSPREDGAVAVLVAVLAVVLFAAAAFAVDLGAAWSERRHAQTAADAAALAGAQAIGSADPTATAGAYAANNGLGGAAVNVPPTSGANVGDSSCVEVIVDNTIPTVFAGVIGTAEIDVNARAVACSSTLPGHGPCALCILGPSGLTLSGNGNTTIAVPNGGIVVNSDSDPAVRINGNADVTAERMGGPSAPSGWEVIGNGSFNPAPVTQAAIPDPLAHIPMCPAAGTPNPCPTGSGTPVNVSLNGNNTETLSPGVYGTISANGNSSLTFSPGNYVIGSLSAAGNADLTLGAGTYVFKSGFSFAGNGALDANGVTLYFACSSYPTPCNGGGQAGSSFTCTGNCDMDVSAPTSGPFDGLSMFADRNNTSSDYQISGNGSTFGGTIYLKSGGVRCNGNCGSLNSYVVVKQFVLNGNASVTVDGDPDDNAELAGPGGAVLSE